MIHHPIIKRPEHETKYVLSNNSIDPVIQFLKSTCIADSAHPKNTVSSIYFDTKHWQYLSEKINSDYLKKKIRIRWYADLDNTKQEKLSFAEVKYKIGNQRKKLRIKTPFSGKWLNTAPLEDSAFMQLPDILINQGVRINRSIFPVFHIQYKRRRFIEPYTGARICLDYDISTPRVNGVMVPRINPFALSTAVFEMKGHIQGMPISLKPLILLGCKKMSFSKYQACFQKVMQVTF